MLLPILGLVAVLGVFFYGSKVIHGTADRGRVSIPVAHTAVSLPGGEYTLCVVFILVATIVALVVS